MNVLCFEMEAGEARNTDRVGAVGAAEEDKTKRRGGY
jgi:hypothetical protein